MIYSEYTREVIEQVNEQKRNKKLQELSKILTQRLSQKNSHDDYFDEVKNIITDLREVGHDLWSNPVQIEWRQ
jgi:hypothetical protein